MKTLMVLREIISVLKQNRNNHKKHQALAVEFVTPSITAANAKPVPVCFFVYWFECRKY